MDEGSQVFTPMSVIAKLVAPRDTFNDTKPVAALDRQVGGDHYKKLAIQPMSYGMENKLDPLQFSIVKYVTRFRDKGGTPDLEKAKHCIDMLIEHELAKPPF